MGFIVFLCVTGVAAVASGLKVTMRLELLKTLCVFLPIILICIGGLRTEGITALDRLPVPLIDTKDVYKPVHDYTCVFGHWFAGLIATAQDGQQQTSDLRR